MAVSGLPRTKQSLWAVVATLGMLVFANGAAADDAKLLAYGRHLARECTSCHRLDGINNGIPSIVGWPTDVFVNTLKIYRDGARTNPVMVSVAGSLTDEQMQALAMFFASTPKSEKTEPAPGKKIR